jgi:hypothetical protein
MASDPFFGPTCFSFSASSCSAWAIASTIFEWCGGKCFESVIFTFSVR